MYLASGRPVVTQNTGFTNVLASGSGFKVASDSLESAADGFSR